MLLEAPEPECVRYNYNQTIYTLLILLLPLLLFCILYEVRRKKCHHYTHTTYARINETVQQSLQNVNGIRFSNVYSSFSVIEMKAIQNSVTYTQLVVKECE